MHNVFRCLDNSYANRTGKTGVTRNGSNQFKGMSLPINKINPDHSELKSNSVASNKENYSVSSTSSISENSDLVNLNGEYNKGSKERNPAVIFENKNSPIALFIGDLHDNIDEELLKTIFKKYQSLLSVKLCLDSKTGKSLGHGYLNFMNKEDADKAIEEFNYTSFFGKEIRIMPSLRNAAYRKNVGTNVFFSNLPLSNKQLTTRYFYDVFKKYGKIFSCKLDSRKNIGFVYFENEMAARNAIKDYNNQFFLGNIIACGIHFNKEVRSVPEFEKNISRLDSEVIVVKEKMNTSTEDLPFSGIHDYYARAFQAKESKPFVPQVKDEPVSLEEKDMTKINIISASKSCPHSNSNLGGNEKVKNPGYKESTEDNEAAHYQNTVFIKNLPPKTTDEDILNYFSCIGPIKSVYLSKAVNVNYLWAFVTYKNRRDCVRAIYSLNETDYKGAKLEVSKAQPKRLSNRSTYIKDNKKVIDRLKINREEVKKIIVFLENMSSVCNEEFLKQVCIQEYVKFESLEITEYDRDSMTYKGYILCKNKQSASRLTKFLNNRLVGGSVVKAYDKIYEDKLPRNVLKENEERKRRCELNERKQHDDNIKIDDIGNQRETVTSNYSSNTRETNPIPMNYSGNIYPNTQHPYSWPPPGPQMMPMMPFTQICIPPGVNNELSPFLAPHHMARTPFTNINAHGIPQPHGNYLSNKMSYKPFYGSTEPPNYDNNCINLCTNDNVESRVPCSGQPYMNYNTNATHFRRVMDALRRQVRKGIDFLKSPSATRKESLKCITEYIFDVYWQGDIANLTNFMLLLNTSPKHEAIFQSQVEEAVKYLGFER